MKKNETIVLDQDYIDLMRTGCTLYERCTGTDLMPGDILSVKETWLYYGGKYVLRADLPESLRIALGPWLYANQLPKEGQKRKVEVVSVKGMPYEEYISMIPGRREDYYNHKYFSIKGCPADKWFRRGIPVDPPKAKEVTVIEYRLIDEKGADKT